LRYVVPRLLREAQAIGRVVYEERPARYPLRPAPDHKPSLAQAFGAAARWKVDALVRSPSAFARAA